MVFYEVRHGISAGHFLFEKNTDHSFPLHMHRSYEMVLMLEGEMKVNVDQDELCLREGDLILIKPNRVHGYETEAGKSGNCLLCVFSGDLIAAINEPLNKYRFHERVIHRLDPLYRELFARMSRDSDMAEVKGFLYLLCGLFYRQLDFTTEDAYSDDKILLRDILVYIENNIDRSCTLSDLAQKLKYNESYLSRFFVKSMGIPYWEYVRHTKINHACCLLRDTNDSILDIAMKCGYVSPSSFNRSFKQLMGINPSQYRVAVRKGLRDGLDKPL